MASMPESAGSGAIRQRLGSILAGLREHSGHTVDQAAKKIERGRQTVWKIENGKLDVRIKPESDVGRLCDLYGADAETRQALMLLAEQANVKGWFQPFVDLLVPNFDVYLGLEETATHIAWYDPINVPGLMQTETYAREIISSINNRSPHEIERRLELRLRRQDALRRHNPINLNVVLHESALRCMVGGPRAMAEQLRQLNELGGLSNVRLRVIPFEAGAHGGMTSGWFEILRFSEDNDMPPMVYTEGFLGGLWFKEKEEMAKYESVFADAESKALDEDSSRELIEQIAKEYSRA